MYGSILLSDFISELKDKLEKYGDGKLYMLGECTEHLVPYVDVDVKEEIDYVWNEKKQIVEEVVKNKTVTYKL